MSWKWNILQETLNKKSEPQNHVCNTLPLHKKREKKYMQNQCVKYLCKDTLEINSTGSLLKKNWVPGNRDRKEVFHWILLEPFEF